MKKFLVLIVLLFSYLSFGEYPETKQSGWGNFKSTTAGVVDTSILAAIDTTGANRKWAAINTSNFAPSSYANNIMFRFRSTTNNATGVYEVWAYRDKDDAQFVCAGAITAGTQLATMGGYFVQTITITSERYLADWSVTTGGSNETAVLYGDGCGAKRFVVLLTTVSAGTIYVDGSGF